VVRHAGFSPIRERPVFCPSISNDVSRTESAGRVTEIAPLPAARRRSGEAVDPVRPLPPNISTATTTNASTLAPPPMANQRPFFEVLDRLADCGVLDACGSCCFVLLRCRPPTGRDGPRSKCGTPGGAITISAAGADGFSAGGLAAAGGSAAAAADAGAAVVVSAAGGAGPGGSSAKTGSSPASAGTATGLPQFGQQNCRPAYFSIALGLR
jgi:hypothetical protein